MSLSGRRGPCRDALDRWGSTGVGKPAVAAADRADPRPFSPPPTGAAPTAPVATSQKEVSYQKQQQQARLRAPMERRLSQGGLPAHYPAHYSGEFNGYIAEQAAAIPPLRGSPIVRREVHAARAAAVVIAMPMVQTTTAPSNALASCRSNVASLPP